MYSPDGTEATFLVRSLDDLEVVFRHAERGSGVLDEKRVVCVAGRVRLRLEQRVEVPERRLHELVGRHLLETDCDGDADSFGSVGRIHAWTINN